MLLVKYKDGKATKSKTPAICYLQQITHITKISKYLKPRNRCIKGIIKINLDWLHQKELKMIINQ